MKSGREYLDYLNDIMDAVRKIEKFVQGMDFEQFRKDDKSAFAVIRALEIIGEATKKIPKEVKNHYSSVPWKDMAGIRNKLIHEYFGVNLKVVWKTTQEDLPLLKRQIGKMIKESSK